MATFIDKDEFILKMLLSDDPQAMTILFAEHFQTVTRVSYRITGDKDIAKDIAQELFITIWEKRHSLNFKKPIKSYLARAAINESLFYLRKQNKIQLTRLSELNPSNLPFGDTLQNPERDITFEELEEYFRQIIDNLPPKCKLVYRLHRDENMTYEEIAKHLDVSVKTVEKHISRALKSLREFFKNLMPLFIGL